MNIFAKILSTLNYESSLIAREIGVNAMTDVTGFGLLGHLYEMSADNYTIEIAYEKVPFIKEAIYQASMGIIPAGSYNNQIFVEKYVEFVRVLSFEEQMILYDAQTSGGLLISLPQDKAKEYFVGVTRAKTQVYLISTGDTPSLIKSFDTNTYELIDRRY